MNVAPDRSGEASFEDLYLTALLARARAHRTAPGELSELPRLTASAGLFGSLLHSAFDALVLNERHSRLIIEASDSFLTLTGYSRAELVGRTSAELGLVDDAGAEQPLIDRRIDAGQEGRYERVVTRKDGTTRWVEFSHQLVRGNAFVLTVLRDVSERKELEEQLRLAAEIDSLTQIANRRRFEQVANAALRVADEPVCIALVDLDEFKVVNDTHGHLIGDEALRAAAECLVEATRTTDLVARLGGDEFAILLPGATTDVTHTVVDRFRRLLADHRPVAPGLELSATVGVAARTDPATTYSQLLGAADADLMRQKRARPYSVHLGGPSAS